MASLLKTLSIIAFALAGICLLLALFFFFFFKIPTVIGDLTGRTARKSIAKMRATNTKTGVKSYKEDKTNVERGKVTKSIPHTAEPTPVVIVNNNNPETGLLAENKSGGLESEETGMLEEATGMLESETTGLLVDENSTAPLSPPVSAPPVRIGGKKLEMLETVMLTHTEESI